MSIDLSEYIVSLKDACGFFPRARRGRKAHVSRLYRYTRDGCRGVILESIQCGATRCTSREAIERFFQRLTAASNPGKATELASQTEAKVEAEMEREVDAALGLSETSRRLKKAPRPPRSHTTQDS